MPNRPPQPPNPKPVTGSTSTNTTGGGAKSTKPGTGILGTSTNPIYGGGSTLMTSINSLTTPPDRGSHTNRTPTSNGWSIGRIVNDVASGLHKVGNAAGSAASAVGKFVMNHDFIGVTPNDPRINKSKDNK
jgi:hypothetical protein